MRMDSETDYSLSFIVNNKTRVLLRTRTTARAHAQPHSKFGACSLSHVLVHVPTNPRNTPTAITALGTDVETCVAGNYHNLCRKTDGTWLGWGYNFYNQLL